MQLLEEGNSASVRHVYLNGDFVPAEVIHWVHRERKENLIILAARS